MSGKLRRELRGDALSVRRHQGKIFAGAVQLEVRVQRLGRIGAVLIRGEHQHVITGREDLCRKRPLIQVVGIIAEMPAVEIDALRCGIVNLDPIGKVAVFISQRVRPAAVVDRQQLANHQPAVEHQPRFEPLAGGAKRAP